MTNGRLLTLGQDAEGRSCVVDEQPLVGTPIPGVDHTTFMTLFKTDQSPPPPCPTGRGIQAPDALAPGLVHWYIVDHEAAETADLSSPASELHQRNAIECVYIMSGGGDMLLDDGTHPVRAGDCIVMPGSSHGLVTGPDGCCLMSFSIGTAAWERA
jgi:mannose-6-phosphate isomerase-like protein (cupin superfamily)